MHCLYLSEASAGYKGRAQERNDPKQLETSGMKKPNLWEAWRETRSKARWARRKDDSFARYFNAETENRELVATAINRLDPSTVYEFGCYSGPNLRRLKAEIWGSDINSHALEYAAKALPHGNFRLADGFDALEDWLPKEIDVSVAIAVFYTMRQDAVRDVLVGMAKRSRFLVLGDNFTGASSPHSTKVGSKYVHAWDALLESVGEIITRVEVPGPDYSLTEVVTVRSLFRPASD